MTLTTEQVILLVTEVAAGTVDTVIPRSTTVRHRPRPTAVVQITITIPSTTRHHGQTPRPFRKRLAAQLAEIDLVHRDTRSLPIMTTLTARPLRRRRRLPRQLPVAREQEVEATDTETLAWFQGDLGWSILLDLDHEDAPLKRSLDG